MEIEFHYLALIALATSFVVGGISQALSKRTRRVNYIPVVAVFLVSFGLMAFGGNGFPQDVLSLLLYGGMWTVFAGILAASTYLGASLFHRIANRAKR